ncbi:hypothetical protein [Brachybacterium epidermidis]|uniref:hypothetical protein n=1 Tax=Brachybacterium epidermidis TaxID=2781983 RepID=UPI00398F0D42
MSKFDALRGKLPRRSPGTPKRSDRARRSARRRNDPAVLAAGEALADAREVFGDVPRGADADQLVRRARRLMRQAALDEFAREGVSLVQLPQQWGRAELRRADVPGDAAFQSFVSEVLAAIDIAPSLLERDDAIELTRAPSSADAYGLSLEVAADLASFLLTRAWRMERGAHAAQAATEQGVGLEAERDRSLPSEEEYVTEQAGRIREEVRTALVRVVTVPLELKEADDKHRRIEERRTGRAEADDSTGTRPRVSAGAGAGRTSTGTAWTGATSSAGEGSTGPVNDDGGTEDGAPHRGIAEQVAALHGFATSDTGRKTFEVMRTVGERAFDMYQQREASREDGGGSGAGGSGRTRKRPPSS